MKPINWTVVAIIAAVIIGLLGGWGLTTMFTPKCPTIKADTTWLKPDSIPYAVKPKIIYVPKDTGSWHYKDSIRLIHDTVKSKEDSLVIYKRFFSENKGSIIIVDDKNIFISGDYNISQNKLLNLTGKYVNKIPTQTITNKITNPPVSQLYLGIGLGTQIKLPRTVLLPISILLKNKKDNLYSINYDPFGNSVMGSTYIKIRFKKK